MNATETMKAILRSYNILKLTELAIKRELTDEEMAQVINVIILYSHLSNKEIVIELLKKMKAA